MTVAHRFVDTARRHPRRPAVQCPDGVVIDYATLLARAAALASRLRASGADRGSRVLLHVEADIHWAVGVWGIWLAGAAVAPIDQRTPPVRLAELIRDIRPVQRVTRVDNARADVKDVTQVTGVMESWLPGEHDLAWLIHSSGSTGRPKGVRVPHRGVPELLDAQCHGFALHSQARVLAVLSPGFDASLSDLMTTHTSGACLVIPEAGVLSDPQRLLDTLARERITHVDLPPAVIARVDPERLPETLQTVVMGGEVCPIPAARAWARRVRLINVYGPTEATICTSMVRVDPARWHRPEMGTPRPGVRYRIEGEELWIGGSCLADGYTDPELTAVRFVHLDGERWFRTGDRVEPVGEALVFHGRLDRMVKIQGRLAHPEEVERALADQPGIRRAAAWVHDGRLHAAVAGRPEAELRPGLCDRLPAWMVPATITVLETLPLTATGKVDIAALRRASAASPATDFLTALWSRALGRPVAPEDDLDAAGRDSFATLEVLSEMDRLQLSVEPDLVAGAPTCAVLAERIGEAPAATGELDARLPVMPVIEPALCGPSFCGRPERLLMTGATGQLGAALLPRLLDAGVEVWALTRRPEILPSHPRLHPVRGELTAPQLGLCDLDWHELATTMDTVVHLAADLHALAPASALWAVNVGGTAAVLGLATVGRPKRTHHASTLAVFACSDRPAGPVDPTTPLPESGHVSGGYAQTKWAAERLATTAGAAVHRLGHLIGRRLSGALRQVVRGMAALQPAEPLPEVICNLTPLDAAADALAAAIVTGERGTTHLAGPSHLTLPALVEAIRGRRFDASPVELALARRVLLAPFSRHPSNVFLSTGWCWGGSLPAVHPDTLLVRLVDEALEVP